MGTHSAPIAVTPATPDPIRNGQLDYDGERWRVKLAPHVARRFKSWMLGYKPGEVSPFTLTPKPDLALDIDAFLHRYPLRVSPEAARALDRGLLDAQQREVAIQTISSGAWEPHDVLGFRRGFAPYDYQVRGADLCLANGSLLLMDDVGLGKTWTAMCVMLQTDALPALVIVPPGIVHEWAARLTRFTNLRPHIINSTTPYNLPRADVYILAYSKAAGWADHAEQIGHRLMVLDEAHEVRHGDESAKGRAVMAFSMHAEIRLGLTATPIWNYGGEIFNVIDAISPGALGEFTTFTKEWCTYKGNHWVVEQPQQLGAYLESRALTLRRTEIDGEVDGALPPLVKVMHECEWSTRDAKFNADDMRRLAEKVLNDSDWKQRGQAARKLDLEMRHITGVAKAREVAAYVRMLVEAGEQVLVCAWHREVWDIYRRAWGDIAIAFFTGAETQRRKADARDQWMDGRIKILGGSLRSMVGLDGLQHRGCHIVFGEFDWSPQVHAQAIGRLRRHGQGREVTAHYCWVDDGADPPMLDMLGLKASQSHGIISPYADPIEAVEDPSRMRALARSVIEQAGAR